MNKDNNIYDVTSVMTVTYKAEVTASSKKEAEKLVKYAATRGLATGVFGCPYVAVSIKDGTVYSFNDIKTEVLSVETVHEEDETAVSELPDHYVVKLTEGRTEEDIADLISDEVGFCISSLKVRHLSGAFYEGYDIEWDL